MSSPFVKPKSVRIVEVGPRDGLQNEKGVISSADKVEFIHKLAEAGVKTLEATSFVSPKKIPQLADAAEVFPKVAGLASKVDLCSLVPNEKGLEIAHSVGVKEIAIFTATSNTFNQKNINATIDESLTRLEKVVKGAHDHGMKIRGYVSTVFGCPYEGETSVDELVRLVGILKDWGCYDISLGDTIGVARPTQVKEIFERLKRDFPIELFSAHFHDTFGVAVANSMAALESGVVSFDSSAGGLGGCPYAKGASGNVATEDLIHFFHSMGIETGIDPVKLAKASEFILQKIGKESLSKCHQYYVKQA